MQIQPPLSPYNKLPHTFPSIFFGFIEYLLSTQYTTKKSDQEMRGWVHNKSKVGGISPKKWWIQAPYQLFSKDTSFEPNTLTFR